MLKKLIAALVVLACLVPAAPAAGSARISGKVAGLSSVRGRPSRHIVVVRAISAKNDRIAASVRLTRALRYVLKVPPGAYVVVGDVADLRRHRSYTARSHVIAVKRGGNRRTNLRARHVRKSAAVARPAAVRTSAGRQRAAAAAARATKTIGVSPALKIDGLPGWDRGLPIDGYVISGLTRPCPGSSGTDLQLVELRHRKEILDEIKLSNSHLADPKSHVTPHFVKNQYVVTGGGQASGGSLTVGLQLVDRASGQVVASAEGTGTEASFYDVMDRLIQDFLQRICEPSAVTFDVAFEGSGTYAQSQGPALANGANQTVDAPFSWRVSYTDVGIYTSPHPGSKLSYSQTPESLALKAVSGTYTKQGETAPGPPLEKFSCTGQTSGYQSPPLEVTGTAAGQSVAISSLSALSSDSTAPSGCTPSSMDPGWGSGPGVLQAMTPVFQISDADLSQSSFVKSVSSGSVQVGLPSDCTGSSIFSPCAQTLTWSGTVTFRKTCDDAAIEPVPGLPLTATTCHTNQR